MAKHQTIELNINVENEYLGEEVELISTVKHIMLDYPFRIEHDGSQNVYAIMPCNTLSQLIDEVEYVMTREYEHGKCAAPHAFSDFVIEGIVVHENNCANIIVDS